ncbi:hypothetical protein ABZ532_05025 [Streptomyces sp. NPDC019396]|uniref:hypothetical protein n=1 Tax=Streptomyces sp. NPDC019396 TaxID=3154687 RepID=UPI0033D31E8D
MKLTKLKTRRALVAVTLAIVLAGSGTFYLSGAYDDWRGGRAIGAACEGVLAPEDTLRVLGGKGRARSGAGDLSLLGDPAQSLARCGITTSAGTAAVLFDVRWGGDADAASLFPGRADLRGATGSAAPLGGGWPGTITSASGQSRVSIALQCRNRHDESLLVSSVLSGGAGPGDRGERTALARATAQAAANAADRFDCTAAPGGPITTTPADPLTTSRPLSRADGTCAPVRSLAPAATRSGVPNAMESASQPQAPLADCFLATPDGRPGYGMSAVYGPYAKSLKMSGPADLRRTAGFSEDGNHAWATAQCPGSSERALFTLWRIFDTDDDAYPVRKPARDFEKNALTAFAEQSARQHGCSDLRLP